jgi:hypothetical protein
MDDFFSAPSDYIETSQDSNDEVSPSPVPPDAFKHRGKWLALHGRRILAIRDTEAELRKEFADRRSVVSFFHVPTTSVYAR